MPQADFLTVFYEVFDDQGHTIPSAEHSEAFETITLTESGAKRVDASAVRWNRKKVVF